MTKRLPASAYSPMTAEEREAGAALGAPTYLPGSYEKRFARSMLWSARTEAAVLTDRQRRLLWKMIFRYRRQIPDKSLVELAERRLRDLSLESLAGSAPMEEQDGTTTGTGRPV